MAKKTKSKPKTSTPAPTAAKTKGVKKENIWLIALSCLVVGFVAGVIFGVYKSGQLSPVAHPESGGGAMPPQASAPQMADETRRMIAELEGQVEKDPENLEAWTHLGHLYFDSNQVDKAITAYNRSLELDGENPDVWTDLGVMYRRAKQPEDALKAFATAITINPKHEIARYNTGIVLLHDMNDAPGAIKAWEGLLAINPQAQGPGGTSVRQMVDQMKKGEG